MLYIVALLVALTVSLLVVCVAEFAPSRTAGLTRQLDELRRSAGALGSDEARKLDQRVALLLQNLGERFSGHRQDDASVRAWLTQAGFHRSTALPIYWGARIGLVLLLGGASFLLAPLLTEKFSALLLSIFWSAAVGWIGPVFYIRSRIKKRQKDIQRALPDALDMLVVCVEAGLGLNQALVRVAEEIHHVSPLLGQQMMMVNLEIRAGTAREEALRNLSDRTGLSDVSSLVSMLIQTDRFGTSVANALRVQASSLRTKRRQRTEEAAAKTAIKLVFPLVLFIFPALFVVILGPALIQIFETLGSFM
jgi:tight adherence protein C